MNEKEKIHFIMKKTCIFLIIFPISAKAFLFSFSSVLCNPRVMESYEDVEQQHKLKPNWPVQN